LSLISYYIGYFSLNIHKIDIYYIDKHRFAASSAPNNNEILSRNIALAYIFVGLISFFFIVKGSMLNFITNLNLRLLTLRGHGFLVFLSFFLGVGILLYFCYTLLWSKKLYKLLNIYFVICLLIIYLFEGSRGRVFIIVLSMMVWYHYRIKRIALKKIFKIALVVFVIFFGFHIFRSFKSWKQNDIDFEKKIGSTHAIVKTMFSQTEKLLPIINKKPPELLKGKSYLSPIMVWIPKFLYPDKPKIGIGHFYTNYYFPDAYNKGVSYGPGPIGDSILNFGIPGIIINFMLFGLVLNRIYNSLIKKYNSPFYLVFYSILVSTVCFISVSQNMINSITLLMFFFVPLLIYKLIINFKFVIKNILYSKFRTVVFDAQLKI
jgi:oligosaccharide repeat unit polymerase